MNYKLRIKKSILRLFFAMFCLGLVLPAEGLAAQFILNSDVKNIKVADQFEVKFFLNSENESINAVEGAIVFPQELLELKEVKISNSIISFWSKSPRANGGLIDFSGVVPGGYAGQKGLIFSVIFQARAEGAGSIGVNNPIGLRNDGKGTSVNITIAGLQFTVKGYATDPVVPTKQIDAEPPEVFLPAVGQEKSVFGGKYFLVFSAQDKGSGINHYEVCEGKSSCVEAESLYLLKNQDLDEEIIVKAIDNSGNERSVKFSPQKPLKPRYLNFLFGAIIILAILFASIIWSVWRKR